jgi:hypothetical protein
LGFQNYSPFKRPDFEITFKRKEPEISSGGRIFMGEHIMHKKETKKAPQKTLKEKRKEKKDKEKKSGSNISES